jgi:hypothetical protein
MVKSREEFNELSDDSSFSQHIPEEQTLSLLSPMMQIGFQTDKYGEIRFVAREKVVKAW